MIIESLVFVLDKRSNLKISFYSLRSCDEHFFQFLLTKGLIMKKISRLIINEDFAALIAMVFKAAFFNKGSFVKKCDIGK